MRVFVVLVHGFRFLGAPLPDLVGQPQVEIGDSEESPSPNLSDGSAPDAVITARKLTPIPR
jgi:hypothetical protein